MRGEYRRFCLREGKAYRVRIKDSLPAVRSECPHHMVAPAAEARAHHHHVCTVSQGEEPVDVLSPDNLPLKPFIDEVRDGFKDRRRYPHDIRPRPECAKTAEIRSPLVRASADHQDFPPVSFVRIMPSLPHHEEITFAGEYLSLEGDADIGDQ